MCYCDELLVFIFEVSMEREETLNAFELIEKVR